MVASASETRATPLPPAAKAPTFFLPDFCSSPAVFAVVLIAELVALVIALARQALHDNFWADLAGGSLFLLWVGLTCAAVLCRARPWLQTMPPPRAAMIAVGLLVITIGVVSEIVFQVGQFWGVDANDGGPGFFPKDHAGFVLRNIAVGFIVSALALRYFYVSAEWKRSFRRASVRTSCSTA
jgi:two-component system sensor histidine kinase AlgZ